MAIEHTPGGTTITGSDIGRFRLLSLRGRLRLEIAGLKFRGRTTYAILKRQFGMRGSREAVLEQLNHMIEQDLESREENRDADRE